MRIQFACPSCGAAGAADAAFAGKAARCKHCNHRFTIPGPGEANADVYALDEPVAETFRPAAASAEAGSTFVSARGDEPASSSTRRKPKRTRTKASARSTRTDRSERPWGKWLLGSVVAAVLVLATVAVAAPRGLVIVGCVLIIVGCVLILAGYGAGAFGAFSEDFVYGMLYLLVPLYAGYYLLTRWDDLWVWFTCSTVGFGLILFGTELLRWAGVSA